MHWPHFLTFAGPASWAAIGGAALLLLSVLAGWGEHRRRRRRDIDAVGLMPWRDVAALTSFAGLMLMIMALAGWAGG